MIDIRIISLSCILQAFTLNSVPPIEDEIVAGGIGCNFISRDLLEASGIDDAVTVRCFIALLIYLKSC